MEFACGLRAGTDVAACVNRRAVDEGAHLVRCADTELVDRHRHADGQRARGLGVVVAGAPGHRDRAGLREDLRAVVGGERDAARGRGDVAARDVGLGVAVDRVGRRGAGQADAVGVAAGDGAADRECLHDRASGGVQRDVPRGADLGVGDVGQRGVSQRVVRKADRAGGGGLLVVLSVVAVLRKSAGHREGADEAFIGGVDAERAAGLERTAAVRRTAQIGLCAARHLIPADRCPDARLFRARHRAGHRDQVAGIGGRYRGIAREPDRRGATDAGRRVVIDRVVDAHAGEPEVLRLPARRADGHPQDAVLGCHRERGAVQDRTVLDLCGDIVAVEID